MKIHIVQKGDTLWNLAQKYEVDFELLQSMNDHLDDPDQIEPGMKIKIPTAPSKTVKNPAPHKVKIGQQHKATPHKATPPKASPKTEAPKQEKLGQEDAKAHPDHKDHELLKQLLKKISPHLLKKLLYDEKPEVVQEIKIDIEMHQTNVTQTEEKKIQHLPMAPKHLPVAPTKGYMCTGPHSPHALSAQHSHPCQQQPYGHPSHGQQPHSQHQANVLPHAQHVHPGHSAPHVYQHNHSCSCRPRPSVYGRQAYPTQHVYSGHPAYHGHQAYHSQQAYHGQQFYPSQQAYAPFAPPVNKAASAQRQTGTEQVKEEQ